MTNAMKHTEGFTLAEIVVVGFLVTTMFLLATQTLFRGQRSATLTEVSSQLVRDLREAQIQAMQGVAPADGSIVDRSIRFESDRYIVFPGLVYDSGNAENRVVPLDSSMRFSVIAVPGNTVTFIRGSGEVLSYTPDSDTVVLQDTSLNNSVTISVNKYGVVSTTRQ